MTQVYYWKGAHGENALLTEHHDTIMRLLNQDYASTDLEKLRSNHKNTLYSFRLNQADRLLFTTRTVNGKHYLHILEYVQNHDYQKSRFLKNHVLRDYLNKQKQAGSDNEPKIIIEFEPLTQSDEKPRFETQTDSTPVNIIPLDFFNQQFIQLHDEQQHIMNQALPLIINGVGGSGKTYLALSFLTQFINTYSSDEPTRILYVTKEATLVNTIKKHWDDLCTIIPSTIQVEFLTYDQLLAHYVTFDTHPDDKYHYRTWLNTQKKSTSELDDQTQFHEFRICSAHTQDQYLALGEHQSTCPSEQRAHLYHQYLAFQAYLTHNHLIDPIFYALTAQPAYARIVVDEAQNLALRQLHNIHQLAIHNAILYCMDPQQNLIDQSPIRRLLQQLYWAPERGLESINLNRTYRCPANITNTVNTLLRAKHHLLGKIDKNETETLLINDHHLDPGHVVFTSKKNLNAHNDILQRHTSTHFAVVTQEHLLDEARIRFDTPLVFTVEQIQGLEYHTVVIYQLLEDEKSQQHLKTIHKPLMTLETDKRSKQSKQDHHYLAPWFNGLYTAYTRAQNTLLICEDVQANKDGLIRLLQNSIQNIASVPKHSVTTPNTNATDWEAEALKQQAKGNFDIEQQIRARYLKPEPVSALAPIADKSIAPSVPVALSTNKKNKNKTKTKNTSFTEAQTEALDILNRFTENGTISTWVKKESFLTTLFHAPISIRNEPSQSLFSHIIQSDTYTKRFAIAIGLPSLKFINQDFMARAINYSPLPNAIIDKLLHHMLIRENTVLNLPTIQTWVRQHLTGDRLKQLFLNACQTDNDCISFINIFIDHQLLDGVTINFFAQILAQAHPKTYKTPLWILTHANDASLKSLIDCHPNIIQAISPEAWSSAITSKTGITNENDTNQAELSIKVLALLTQSVLNLQHLADILRHLNTKQRYSLFEVMKNRFVNQIPSTEILIRITLMFGLSKEQFRDLLILIKHNLPDLINTPQIFVHLVQNLNDERFIEVLNAIKKHLPSLINTPETLVKLLLRLGRTRQRDVLLTLKDHLHIIIINAQTLSLVLRELYPESCREILLSIQDKILSLINNFQALSNVLCHLNQEQRAEILAAIAIKDRLHDWIKNANDVSNVLCYLDDIQSEEVLTIIQKQLPSLINSTQALICIIRFINEAQCRFVLDTIREKLPRLIQKPHVLLDVLSNLEKAKCKAVLTALESQLPGLINSSPQAVFKTFYHLEESQRRNVFNVIKEGLRDLFKNMDDLIHVIYYLDEVQRAHVFTIINSQLSGFINTAKAAGRLLSLLNGVGPRYTLFIIKRRLRDLIKSPDDLFDALYHLNETECRTLLAAIKQALPDLINCALHVGYVFRNLNEAQYRAVLSVIEPDLPNLIKSPEDLSNVLRFLDEIPCRDLLATIKNHTLNLIKNVQDLIVVIQYLNQAQCQGVLDTIQSQLPELISSTQNLIDLLSCLDEVQCKVTLVAIKNYLSARTVGQVFRGLNTDQCGKVLSAIQDYLPELINRTNDLVDILFYLDTTQRERVLQIIKPAQWAEFVKNEEEFYKLNGMISSDAYQTIKHAYNSTPSATQRDECILVTSEADDSFTQSRSNR